LNAGRGRRQLILRAERLKNHVPKHVSLGLSFADLPNIDELLHQ